MDLYYEAYEKRYQAVREVGDYVRGHTPDDNDLIALLGEWTQKHSLTGKKVVEFACGEGAGGVVLSRLGCMYQGYDIAPSAIEKTRALLKEFLCACADRLDLVRESLPENTFDAALDVMGFHMIITDSDRNAYLNNMYRALRPGSPAFFIHESYRENAYCGPVETFADWERTSDSDYSALHERRIGNTGKAVFIPLVPARARNKADYIKELTSAGFIVDEFIEMGENTKCMYSASIHAHKPSQY